MPSLALARSRIAAFAIRAGQPLANAVYRWKVERFIDSTLTLQGKHPQRPTVQELREWSALAALISADDWGRTCLFLAEAALARTPDAAAYVHEYRHDFVAELMRLPAEKRSHALRVACLFL